MLVKFTTFMLLPTCLMEFLSHFLLARVSRDLYASLANPLCLRFWRKKEEEENGGGRKGSWKEGRSAGREGRREEGIREEGTIREERRWEKGKGEERRCRRREARDGVTREEERGRLDGEEEEMKKWK